MSEIRVVDAGDLVQQVEGALQEGGLEAALRVVVAHIADHGERLDDLEEDMLASASILVAEDVGVIAGFLQDVRALTIVASDVISQVPADKREALATLCQSVALGAIAVGQLVEAAAPDGDVSDNTEGDPEPNGEGSSEGED